MTDDATTGPDEPTPAPPEPASAQPASARPAPPEPASAAPAPVLSAFAPVPREPWINPAKRRTAALVAAVIAVALFGSGLLVGALATGGHRHHDRWQLRGYEQMPAPMRPPVGGPARPWPGHGHGHIDGHGHGPGGWAVPGPTPPASGPPGATSVPRAPLPSSSHR